MDGLLGDLDDHFNNGPQEAAERIYATILEKVPEVEAHRDSLKFILDSDTGRMKPDFSRLPIELQEKIKSTFPQTES